MLQSERNENLLVSDLVRKLDLQILLKMKEIITCCLNTKVLKKVEVMETDGCKYQLPKIDRCSCTH